ncbi:heterokaryon incompatibility protein-domain-containing protein, partial [Phaeosphaeriaceae sp. PMI808]
YAALSYCWGTTRTFTTTLASLQARKRGFALTDLPKTCRDAVLVTRALGLSYIWIDSLCIIQDSKKDWEKEAAKMCDVYSNAVVTLAGLDSPNSDTGLFISDEARQTTKHYTKLLMGFLHADRAPPPGDDFGGILQTRGWTLQEITLSPRILWFSAWELAWSCRSETACECEPILTSQLMRRSATRLTTLARRNEPVEWLTMWRDFVQIFTRRKLTHQTDQLPALTGIATAISERISGRYYAGLWENQLGKNLLWHTDWFVPPADEQAPQRLSVPEKYSPTWSWASITGPI